jgi:cell division protein FtsW
MFSQFKDQVFTQLPAAHLVKGNLIDRARGDKYIWGVLLLLVLVSLLVVYSATNSLAYKHEDGNNFIYLFRQISFTVVGLLIVYVLHRVNYGIYSRVAVVLYFLSIPLLLYTLLFGMKVNDASRWIKLPVLNLTFQTSDFAKLALFMYLSRQISRSQAVIKDFKKGFLPLFLPMAVTCALIVPANLSNALLTGATSLLLMFIGRVSFKHLFLIVGLALVPILLLIGLAAMTHKEDNIDMAAITSLGRVGTWVSRVHDYMYTKDAEIPYQVLQSNIAIASGGIFTGLGPGNSEARNFLPQAYNDSIYPIIIEEYGLLGGAFVIFLYLLFLYRCILLFKKFPYAFGAFLSLALSFTLVIQAMANMAVGVGLVPVTGVTLPLISMGGTSLIFTCASIGIILSVARHVEEMQAPQNSGTNHSDSNQEVSHA